MQQPELPLDGSSSKTFEGSSPSTTEQDSKPSYTTWPTSGRYTPNGPCWTLNTSGCPNDANESSPSLASILQPPNEVPARYYLSAKSAQGILNRSVKRGRPLPPLLQQALQTVATSPTLTTAFDAKNYSNLDEIRAGSILAVHNPQVFSKSRRAKDPDDFETWVNNGIAPTLNTFENHNDTRATILTVHPEPNQVRRITPLEAERLQGWPDNHTLTRADGTHQPDTIRYRQIGNGITANVAHWLCTQLNTTENHPPHQ